ncbi:MAG: PASTA domain-containing protein [Myxococcaceae bacterium]|nr:PASTA domain-containing protein [Myxococcaceae bacterium]MCI0671953.1 PASTA domain-containing protein [Myxococcaceae bacterium]
MRTQTHLRAAQVSVDAPGRWVRLRVAMLGAVLLCLLGVVLVRAVKLQVFERERLEGLARDQYVRHIEVPARRGDIFDRRGVPLAQSVDVDSVWVDPSLLTDVPRAARALAKRLSLDSGELEARLMRGKRFAWVKRQLKPREGDAVRALGLPGVGYTKEPRRFYPQRELAAHVLGMVGTDGHGLEGLERAFEDELSGESAQVPGLRDARGRKALVEGAADPEDHTGASVTLTLDRHIQYVAEKALAKAVHDARAVAGMVVVMDPATGEVLALANHPRFNPNLPGSATLAQMRNRAALDLYEPGSTMKPFVVAAALEAGAVGPDQTFDCEQGALRIGSHTINDSHAYGLLTPEGILRVSSNIGMTKVAQRLGRERLVAAFQSFGFGERSGLLLPGEGKGSLPFPRADVALATQSFGQGLTATVVQVTAAYAALANGGQLMRPFLVSRVVDPDGVVLLENKPTKVRQVVSQGTARRVVRMLESVVSKGGTAPRAAMPGYRVAGKTGTAQKVDTVAGGYSDKRIASFVGMVPAEAPRLVVHVVVDEPKTDVYGGLVAAPAVREIAEASLAYMGVPPSQAVSRGQVVAEVGREEPPPAAEPPRPAVVEVSVAGSPGGGAVRIPDLQGQVGREAVARLVGMELTPRLVGSGRVVTQRPAAGSVVEKGALVTLELASR